jgi:hypothetical protein
MSCRVDQPGYGVRELADAEGLLCLRCGNAWRGPWQPGKRCSCGASEFEPISGRAVAAVWQLWRQAQSRLLQHLEERRGHAPFVASLPADGEAA